MEEIEAKPTLEHMYGPSSQHQVHGGMHYSIVPHPTPDHIEFTQIQYPTIGSILSSNYSPSLEDDPDQDLQEAFEEPNNDAEGEYEEEIFESYENVDDLRFVEHYMRRAIVEKASKRRKTEKEGVLHTCLAVGCERQQKSRRLCSMHQKQKERGGKLDLKDGTTKFPKGRKPIPFTQHSNKAAKLKNFDKKIDEWGGGKEEGTKMLQAYVGSTYHLSRFPKKEDTTIFEQVGRNIISFMRQLPDKSPLRRPLIKAVSENIPIARLIEVLPVCKQTVINSMRIGDEDNLLLTMKSRPNEARKRAIEEEEPEAPRTPDVDPFFYETSSSEGDAEAKPGLVKEEVEMSYGGMMRGEETDEGEVQEEPQEEQDLVRANFQMTEEQKAFSPIFLR
ncbi:hypothetical protein PROFUN_11810 [Planoprotostelium fungivorum]|uniref:Uncharacterized protein n=1 Tax=Planoprotostelium fungivorum TaxID=1890364 RepID=A0A2P6MRI0_9EUKA|nr:hypothetical protein PROFUN_11810 [Planoprotostelium fungivorum]